MNHITLMFHRIMGIDIVKVFSLNAISTLIRMLAGMISVKVIAVIIGPIGIALLGQLGNFNAILFGLANGGINTGITKYVSQFKNDERLVKKYLSNALRITLICTIIIAIILIIGCNQLSELILLSPDYYYVFVILGVTIILYSFNGLLISVLNGYKQFKKYIKVNIAGTIIGLIYSVILVYWGKLPGALINSVTHQSIVFFVTLWMCKDLKWFNKTFFSEKLDFCITKKYLRFSLMTIISLSMLPMSQMLLRGYVISEISATEAGWWEAMNRISNMYLNVITTAFSVYYLPRLSEITDRIELHNEIMRCYKVIIPMLLGITMSIYLLRHVIVWLLFTPDFYPMETLFIWQLMGDFMKIVSWLLAFLMLAKAMTKMYIISEISFTLIYVCLCFVFIKNNGIIGLTQGYFVNYILYAVFMGYVFRKLIFVKAI